MKLPLRLIVLLLLCTFCLSAQTKDYTRYVDPFIGTGGHGHTFPGATVPFGMVQLSPDTRLDNWDGSSGYHYSDNIIYGFSHTHLSGTGIPDYCDILLMPVSGNLQINAKAGDKRVNGYASKFSHANEKAEPGYYSVKLDDDNILAEMTATTRVGLHRYTFTEGDEANIMFEPQMARPGAGFGFHRHARQPRRGVSAVFFMGERPGDIFRRGIFKADLFNDGVRPARKHAEKLYKKFLRLIKTGHQTVFKFKTKPGEQILVKVALSPVSIEGARKNLAAELPGWDFEKVRADA